jgi:hypothetical protein
MYAVLGLPIPTISHACQARRHGAFGLVTGHITIAYQGPDLGLHRPRETFTNHYRRIEGLGIMYCYNGLGTVIDCGEDPT